MAGMEQPRQYCTFMLDGYYFGVDATAVREVLVDQEVTHVPLVPPVVPGVINLRGDIVTTVDLRCQLELPPRAEGRNLPMSSLVSIRSR